MTSSRESKINAESPTAPTLRRRLIRGGQGQLASHAARVFAQVASVSVLIACWGLHRYGDWLILAAVPTYLAFSDIGFTGAATNDMTMAVGRGDQEHARSVFQAVSTALLWVLGLLAVVLPIIALTVPLQQVLNLATLSESAANWTFVALGFDALLTVYAGLLYGAFASAGRYGEGSLLMAIVMWAEFASLAGVALLGGGPVLGACAMLVAQLIGTIVMYRVMRRRVPWLWSGRPADMRAQLRRLRTPALAAGAIPGALTLNMQGMVLLIGITLGPASAAVFSTLRTVSRAVIQVVASVSAVVTPEISRAFAQNDREFLRVVHRRSCQVAVWMTLAMVLAIAIFGGPLLHLWTSGRVGPSGLLLDLFLITTVIDALWYTSLALLYATNRHQRVAVYYTVVSVVTLPIAYVLIEAWGLDGAAAALLLGDIFMLFPVLHQALPAARDSLRSWLGFVVRPPVTPGMLARVRTRVGQA